MTIGLAYTHQASELATFEQMKLASRWLMWQSIQKPGKAKPDKIPFYVNGTPRGATASPSDAVQLTTYEMAIQAVSSRGRGWGLGFALGADASGSHWQGIDLDNVELNQLTDLCDALPGYVEQSPSGKGLHAIGYGRHFRSLGSNGSGIEAYAGGRFFTVTGRKVRDGEIGCISDYVATVLVPRHCRHDRASSPKGMATVQVSPQTITELRSALNHMRSDDYHLWIDIGHALKTLGDTGRGLWLDWSAKSAKYDPQDAAKWDGFNPQNTDYRAIFARAQVAGWINPQSHAARLPEASGVTAPGSAPVSAPIAAKPFVVPAMASIPPRPWLFGSWLMRRILTLIIAPGGTGKSALMVAVALSLATGREILAKTLWKGPKRVWLWNLEDDGDELSRQVAACAMHHGIENRDYAGRLFVNDAGSSLCTAAKTSGSLIIYEPVNEALIAELKAKAIDVLIIDPFVSSHGADENDNGQIDAIAKKWAAIAREAGCAVVLVHHSRKLSGQQVDADASRGASALTNAARTVLVLNRMTPAEASRLGISEDERRRYIAVCNDKSNRAPPEKADWYRLVSVNLANGGPEGGDSVGVIERWTPPDTALIALATGDEIRARVQRVVSSGEWRANVQASDWVGNAIAQVTGADLKTADGLRDVRALVQDMLSRDQLRRERRPDKSRHPREFIVTGTPVKPMCDTLDL